MFIILLYFFINHTIAIFVLLQNLKFIENITFYFLYSCYFRNLILKEFFNVKKKGKSNNEDYSFFH